MKEDAIKVRDGVVRRIIDANVNRCAEGLRVIEEIARFSSGDAGSSRALKELRHAVRRLGILFGVQPADCRDGAGDVGGRFSTAAEKRRLDFEGVARANFHRAEEALRVIEEFGKLLRPDAAGRVKALRFRLYDLETQVLGDKGRPAGMPTAPFLYTFVDRGLVGADRVAAVTRELLEGGSGMLQYRAKGLSRNEMRRDLAAMLPAAASAGVPVIVNDDPELAAETGADGVHLGARDPEPLRARELLGPTRIIGVSIGSSGALQGLAQELIDYIAVGAIFPTQTKEDAVVAGLSLVSEVKSRTSLPVVAIGGIDADNAERVIAAGADGLAVISAVLRGDIRKNCFTLREIIARKG